MGRTEGQSPGGFQRVYFCNDETMEEKFDYAKAIAELDRIAAKVENPGIIIQVGTIRAMI